MALTTGKKVLLLAGVTCLSALGANVAYDVFSDRDPKPGPRVEGIDCGFCDLVKDEMQSARALSADESAE